LECLLLLAAGARVAGSSLYVAELCRGGTCKDPRFPLLDYDVQKQECICRAHPCWDNAGVSHQCSESSGFPFLHFTYNASKGLTCSCSRVPEYDSLHVAIDLCPGQECDSAKFPILDWDPKERKCFCRAPPCNDVNGTMHTCHDPQLPIMQYREDRFEDGSADPKCECVAKFEKPTSGLRGSRPRQDWGVCSWAPSTSARY